ncbi:MAG: M48 family metalloprotease [Armatimonadetes bacterium]|nr:M48 family metalloprotease [Armatimonadota bacterium]
MRRQVANRLLLVLALAASGMLWGCAPESLVSTSDEVAVGRQAAAEVEATYPVSRDPAANQLVNDIGRHLLSQTQPRQGIEYTFKVLDVNDVNAFALPGGWIYINRGLIDQTRGNRDQLAGVIAHEIGHVQAKHHAEMMGRSALYGIAIGALTKGNVTQWANLFANLNLLSWSRKHEYEADTLAIDYTFASRYNAQGIIDFFRVLQAEQGRGRTPAFLRTHPLTEDRIERAQAYLNRKKSGVR